MTLGSEMRGERGPFCLLPLASLRRGCEVLHSPALLLPTISPRQTSLLPTLANASGSSFSPCPLLTKVLLTESALPDLP